jgi:hypothetical protein
MPGARVAEARSVDMALVLGSRAAVSRGLLFDTVPDLFRHGPPGFLENMTHQAHCAGHNANAAANFQSKPISQHSAPIAPVAFTGSTLPLDFSASVKSRGRPSGPAIYCCIGEMTMRLRSVTSRSANCEKR